MNQFNLPPDKNEESSNCEITKVLRHDEIFKCLITQIYPIDFREKADFKNSNEKLANKHYLVACIDEVLRIANNNSWDLCKYNGSIYMYNGAFWSVISAEEIEDFLGKAAEKLGVKKRDANYYEFKEKLVKQFISASNLPRLDELKDKVLINMQNGTFEIKNDARILRLADRNDFLRYQLPFGFDPNALCPLFMEFLDKVLPDKNLQYILAEYIAYLFLPMFKLEKALILYGQGANGKSVFFDIINALLGKENICNFSLSDLTSSNGYFRAEIGDKLLNYGSEINGKLESALFKLLVSGEPVSARSPHCRPFILRQYAKLIFNCNELPSDVENTNAYYRRFLIVPFNVTLLPHEQDKMLAKKIINNELSGVFNWVMEGMDRLLKQGDFTKSDLVTQAVEIYQRESDTVQMFIYDKEYKKSANEFITLAMLYGEYQSYCTLNGYRYLSKGKFSESLRRIGFLTERKTQGHVVYIKF